LGKWEGKKGQRLSSTIGRKRLRSKERRSQKEEKKKPSEYEIKEREEGKKKDSHNPDRNAGKHGARCDSFLKDLREGEGGRGALYFRTTITGKKGHMFLPKENYLSPGGREMTFNRSGKERGIASQI